MDSRIATVKRRGASRETILRKRAERFDRSYSIIPTTGCWMWTGPLFPGELYPFMGVDGSTMLRAHRYSYERFKGPIPDGLVIDHMCTHTWCVNPHHLEAVTNGENVRRHFARTKACHRGHPYVAGSFRIAMDGDGHPYRACRECARANHQASKARRMLPPLPAPVTP